MGLDFSMCICKLDFRLCCLQIYLVSVSFKVNKLTFANITQKYVVKIS